MAVCFIRISSYSYSQLLVLQVVAAMAAFPVLVFLVNEGATSRFGRPRFMQAATRFAPSMVYSVDFALVLATHSSPPLLDRMRPHWKRHFTPSLELSVTLM